MSLSARIDANACAAHGDCAEIAPMVFRLDGEIAEIIGTGPAQLIIAAAEACPAVAIIVEDDGQQLYP